MAATDFTITTGGGTISTDTLEDIASDIDGSPTRVLRSTITGQDETDKYHQLIHNTANTEDQALSVIMRKGDDKTYVGLMGRITSISPLTCYYLDLNVDDLILYRIVNGVRTQIYNQINITNLASTSVNWRIAMTVQGESIRIALYDITNDVVRFDKMVYELDGNAITGSGQAGFRMVINENSANVRADDFIVEEIN